MRILYLCHRVPYPPNKGEKIRAFHQLKAIAARHEVDLFTLADDPADLRQRSVFLEYCPEVTIVPLVPLLARLKSLPYLITRQPLTVPYFYSRKLQIAVNDALRKRKYDRIYVYCSAMAQYVEHAGDVPVVVDLVDVDSDKWTQYASFSRFPWSALYRREGVRLREYERSIMEKASAVLVSTEREAALMRNLGKAPVHVVANGVDTDYFHASEDAQDQERPAVVFTGDMAYFPNQQAVEFFARDVLPLIRREVPGTQFLIVGRNPNRQVLALRELDGVEVTGAVPDVRPYLSRAAVAVAPFVIAAGIQNKILEAMASGLPVVATTKVTQGLSLAASRLVESGTTAQELAEKTSNLLKHSDLARSLGERCRHYVMAEYTWGAALDHLMKVLEEPHRPKASEAVSQVGQLS